MKILTGVLVILCTTSALTAPSVPDRTSDIVATIQSLEQAKFDAQQRKSAAALDSILDDGLMWVGPNGLLSTKALYLQNLRMAGLTQLKIDSIIVKVFDAQLAIAFGIYDEKGVRAGQPYHQHCRFIDTWSFKGGKWMLIAATATSTIS